MLTLADRPGTGAGTLAFTIRTCAFVLSGSIPLLINPWAGDAFTLPKAQALHAMGAVIAVIWLGSYLLTRQPRWCVTRPESFVWAFLLAALLSTRQSTNIGLSVLGGPGRYEGLMTLVSYLLLYFVGVHYFASMRWVRRIGALAAAAGIMAAAYALWQLFTPPAFFAEALMRDWYGGLGVTRPVSTLGSPVVLGGLLSLAGPFALALAVASSGARRYLWLGGSGLAFAGLILSLTRAAWLAAGVGAVIFIAVSGGLRRQWKVLAGVLVATVAMLAAVAFLAPERAVPAELGSRAASSLDPRAGSMGQRLFIWKQTAGLIRARPVLGWGLETLREVFPYDRERFVPVFGTRPVIVDRAHNDLLQVAVSVGIPGVLAYAAFWAASVVVAVRLTRARGSGGSAGGDVVPAAWLAALVAYLIQAQFSFSAVAVTPLVWLLAGSAAGWDAGLHER